MHEVPDDWSDKKWADWILSVSKVIRYVHPIAESCIESADDYYEKLLIYWITWKDPIVIGFNSLYHMGYCYTYIEDLIALIQSAHLDWQGWQEIGREVGRVVYLLFYKATDYDYPDIRIDYPEEFEKEWETHVIVIELP